MWVDFFSLIKHYVFFRGFDNDHKNSTYIDNSMKKTV